MISAYPKKYPIYLLYLNIVLVVVTIFLILSFLQCYANSIQNNTINSIDSSQIKWIDVKKYIINIELFPEIHKISGETQILANDNSFFSGEVTLALHPDIKINFIKILNSKLNIEKLVSYKRNLNLVLIDCSIETDIILISYFGDPSQYITDKNSFTYIGKEGCYFDDLCAYFPRAGFEQKAYCEMFIKHPNNWTPITQGELISVIDLDNNQQFTHYVNKNKSRCHTLVAGPYKKFTYKSIVNPNNINNNELDFNINVYFFKNNYSKANEYIDEAIKILKFYHKKFGDNKLNKLNIVEIEKAFPGGYGPSEIIYLSSTFISQNNIDDELLAHEIAHQWFGNYVFANLKSNFLNEAFATYASLEYIKNKDFKKYQKISEDFNRQYLSYHINFNTNEVSIDKISKQQYFNKVYQILIYYKGLFILKTILHELEKITKISANDIVKTYLLDFSDKIITIDDFQNYFFNTNSLFYKKLSNINNEKIEQLKELFKKFYFETQIFKVEVKNAYLENFNFNKKRAKIIIERTDSLEIIIEPTISIYAYNQNHQIVKILTQKFQLHYGINSFEFELPNNYLDYFYIIDEEYNYLISYSLPNFFYHEHLIYDIAICLTSNNNSEKFINFCNKLASKFSLKVVNDELFALNEILNFKNILFIGNFKNSILSLLIISLFDFITDNQYLYFNKPNKKLVELRSGIGFKTIIKNPFFNNGIITLIFLNDDNAINIYNSLTLYNYDYCTFNYHTKEYERNFLNYKLSGKFDNLNGIKLLNFCVGISNNIISSLPTNLFLQIANFNLTTTELIIYNNSFKEKVLVFPNKITNHTIQTFNIKDEKFNLKEITNKFELVLNINKTFNAPNAIPILIFCNNTFEFHKISNFLDNLSTYYLDKKIIPIKVNINNLPNSLLAYYGINTIILYNFDFQFLSSKIREILINFVNNGGNIIICGNQLSSNFSKETIQFLTDTFKININSSCYYNLDSEYLLKLDKHFNKNDYTFIKSTFKDIKIPEKYLDPEFENINSFLINCDNPKFIREFFGGFFNIIPFETFNFKNIFFKKQIGNGTICYLPYDIFNESIKYSNENLFYLLSMLNNFNNTHILNNIVNNSIDNLLFSISEFKWPFNFKNFLIFFIFYIIILILIYVFISKRKYNYFNVTATVIIIISILLFLLVYFNTKIVTNIETISIYDFSNYEMNKNIYNLNLHKIYDNKNKFIILKDTNEILLTNHLSNHKSLYYDLINNHLYIKVKDKLLFYPTLFSTFKIDNLSIDTNEQLIIAKRLKNENEFLISINEKITNKFKTNFPILVFVKINKEFFLKELKESNLTFDVNNHYNSIEVIINNIKKYYYLNEKSMVGLKNILNIVDSEVFKTNFDSYLLIINKSSESNFYLTNNLVNIQNKPIGCQKLNMLFFPLKFIDEKDSIISNYFIKREIITKKILNYEQKDIKFTFFSKTLKEKLRLGNINNLATGVFKIKVRNNISHDIKEQIVQSFKNELYKNLFLISHSNNLDVRFLDDESYTKDLTKIIFNHDQNFKYEINENNIIIYISNFNHYLSYNLFDNSNKFSFIINSVSLSTPSILDYKVSILLN